MGIRTKTSPTSSGSSSSGTHGGSTKSKVKEINGELWLLDQGGNPVKKVKKKVTSSTGHNGKNNSKTTGSSCSSSSNNIKEIDGALWQCDENGSPIKKVRRKSDSNINILADFSDHSGDGPPTRPTIARQKSGLDGSRHSGSSSRPLRRISSLDGGSCHGGHNTVKASTRTRGSSRGSGLSDGQTQSEEWMKVQHLDPKQKRQEQQQPKQGGVRTEYIDDKGRRVIIDADGTKTVFDKNGKKLRPKKKPLISGGGGSFDGNDSGNDDGFDDVWGGGKKPKSSSGGTNKMSDTTASSAEEDNEHLLELQRQLEAAQEEIARIAEERERERAKNVKATSQVLELKANHQRAEDEKRKLDLQIKNFEARLLEKEQKLEEMRRAPNRTNSGIGGDHLVAQIADLMAQNDALVEKLKKDKAQAAHELKTKEEELRFLQRELAQMRAENDMLFRGHIADKDPVVDKLYKEKKELEEKLNRKIQNLEQKVVVLQEKNGSLKNDLERATLEIKDDDDEEVRKAKEMAKAVKEGGFKKPADAKRASMWILNSLAANKRK